LEHKIKSFKCKYDETFVVEQTTGVGIFAKLTFTLIGFDANPEAYQLLAEMIHDNGGVYFEY